MQKRKYTRRIDIDEKTESKKKTNEEYIKRPAKDTDINNDSIQLKLAGQDISRIGEIQTNADLVLNGINPIGLMVIDDKQKVVDIEIEHLDGTIHNFKLETNSIDRDWFGTMLDTVGQKTFYASPLIPMPFKRLIRHTGKKVLALYI